MIREGFSPHFKQAAYSVQCTHCSTPERNPMCVKTVGNCVCVRERERYVSHPKLVVQCTLTIPKCAKTVGKSRE